MNLTFFFKGENGKIEYTGPYSLDEKTLTRLKEDFQKYCAYSNPTKGGCYECTFGEESRVLLLKFDEILYIG